MALRLGPAILILTIFIALVLGFILHAISIDELQYRQPEARHFDPSVVIDDKPNDLVWFLQVTDLHLSVREEYARQTDFNEFSSKYVDIFKPDVVLVTGDITDARVPNTIFSSGPQLKEWLAYSNAIKQAGAINKTIWLDVRGNHDNFNVYRPSDPNTLYRQYSIQGKLHSRNYMHILEKDGRNYSFIGVDEVQTPGLKIPFNFIGIVTSEDLKQLRKFKEDSVKANSQYNIWFAHYPTSSIASPQEGLKNIVDGPYLCGHYHTIGNYVVKMHATQQPGFAEVELGDWKHNRRVRLAAIDHQLFSLVDFNFRQFPVALMTNPRPAEYSMPKYEPVGRIANSTHMRVIAFTNASSIESVEISINGGDWNVMTLAENGKPLYTRKWNPKEYAQGLHTAQIRVTDSDGKQMTYTQKFSFDYSRDEFSLGARILLRIYLRSYVMAMFLFVTTICVIPMLMLRFIVYNNDESVIKRHYKGTFLHGLHMISNIPKLFWPLIIIPLWISFGPHFFGYFVDEAIGVCFVWGILIDGTFIHTMITYNAGSLFILLIHIPMLVLLTNQVGACYSSLIKFNRPRSILNARLPFFAMLFALQLWFGTFLFSAYGALSYFSSFHLFWSMFIYAYCLYQCSKLTRADFAKFGALESLEEQQTLREPRMRDDKSSTSDQSTT